MTDTTTPIPSEARDVEAVLADHDARSGPVSGSWACSCGERSTNGTLAAGDLTDREERRAEYREHLANALRAALAAAVPVLLDTDREKAWDEGARCAGGYGHEDSWTQDMSPFLDNPYRTTRIARASTEGN